MILGKKGGSKDDSERQKKLIVEMAMVYSEGKYREV